jgi:hypothetical protein
VLRWLALVLLLAPLAADEIHLLDGTVIEGEVLSADATEVHVRLSAGGMTAERHWPASAVLRIVRGPSARQRQLATLHEAAASLAPDDAAGWSALAQRARSVGDPLLVRAWAERAVAIDRHQLAAQQLLGRELVAGVWMRPHEAATARGLLWHDGRWITWQQRQDIAQEERERREQQRAALASAEQRRRLAQARSAPADYTWPASYRFAADSPLKVIWWGGQYGYTRPCPANGSNLRLTGGWGSVDWKLNLNW